MMVDKTCGHHASVREILDDHESRLRDNRDRILKLEMEAVRMNEKLDLVVRQNAEIKASVDGLNSARTYVLGAIAALGLIWGLAGPALLKMMGVS